MTHDWNEIMILVIDSFVSKKYPEFEAKRAVNRKKLLPVLNECGFSRSQLSTLILYLQSEQILSEYSSAYKGYILDDKNYKQFKTKFAKIKGGV